MRRTKADRQEPKRLTMRDVVAQLVLVVPKRWRKKGTDANPLIERLNTALLNLWSRPFYAYIDHHRRSHWFKQASPRFQGTLRWLLSSFVKIKSADTTLEYKLQMLAKLLVRPSTVCFIPFATANRIQPDLERLTEGKQLQVHCRTPSASPPRLSL